MFLKQKIFTSNWRYTLVYKKIIRWRIVMWMVYYISYGSNVSNYDVLLSLNQMIARIVQSVFFYIVIIFIENVKTHTHKVAIKLQPSL